MVVDKVAVVLEGLYEWTCFDESNVIVLLQCLTNIHFLYDFSVLSVSIEEGVDDVECRDWVCQYNKYIE